MQTFYLDTTDAVWLDSNGNLFSDSAPAITIGSTQQIGIVLVTASPNRGTSAADPATWPRDTSWTTSDAGATVTGMLTIDNDYRHRNKGAFSGSAPTAGATTVAATFSGVATYEIAASGVLSLIETSGATQAVGYNSFFYDASSGVYTFSLSQAVPAPTGGGSYTACAVPQPPLCEAFADAEITDLTAGTIGFSFVADSGRLRELTQYTSVAGVGVNGIELLMYRQTGNTVEPLRAFVLNTATLRNPMGDPGYEADPPQPVQNMIVSAVEAAMRETSPLMTYVTDSTSTGAVVIDIKGGTHYTFTQPLTGLTFRKVENSHLESEIIVTGGTALTVAYPVTVGVIGEPTFEGGKSYCINIRDSILVAGALTPGADVTSGVWYYDADGVLDPSTYNGQTTLTGATISGGTVVVNSDASVGDITLTGDTAALVAIAGTVGSVNGAGADNGTITVTGGTVQTVIPYTDTVVVAGGTVGIITNAANNGSSLIDASAGSVGTIIAECAEVVNVSGTAIISGLTATNRNDSGQQGASVAINGGTVARLYMTQESESETPQSLTISGGTVGLALATQTGISTGTIDATISPTATVINLEN